MVEAGVIGASGYGGGELLRLLIRHPDVNLTAAVSSTYAGKPLAAAFPGMAKRTDLSFTGSLDTNLSLDVVFLAQSNGKAMTQAADFVRMGTRVVDLSADFRFRDPGIYKQWYAADHASPELNAAAVYGLPELNGAAIRGAEVVGNPGCYATASILGLAPLVASGLCAPGSILIDAKSGVSGAGRASFGLDYHYPERNENLSAYKVAGTHRHTPEIEQALSGLGAGDIALSFTPHLIPMTRGIMATCYATVPRTASAADLLGLYRTFYRDAPFVEVVDGLPSTKDTLASNLCAIGLALDSRVSRVTVVSVIDNLIKGAAGQAVQNMNLMFGLDETAGLDGPGVWP